ncbi:MAG: PEGA domain-containing protein [Eubacteriales bacterium]|nr:PEGA domain-containing protein [Eubacteriales bacterium]
MKNTEERTNKMNRWNILLFWVVCSALFLLSGCGKEVTIPVYDDSPDPVERVSVLAIVSNVDEVNGKITLRLTDRSTEIVLAYNGGADVRDAYGDVYSMKQMELGTVADVVYDDNADKLISLYICGNDKVQRLEHVTGATVNISDNVMKFNGEAYQMSNGVVAISDSRIMAMSDIDPKDQLSVWIYNDVVCSVNVELGHGYVKLEDYASYLGGFVEIGNDVMEPVTEDMLLTVREGEYTLRIVKGDDVGTKKIWIPRNQEVTISLADIAIEPKQMGFIMFKVTPSSAKVYIDGKLVNTEGTVEIVYGKHAIVIEAEGYQRYSANFNVNYAYKIKEYTLTPEDGTTEKKTSNNTSTTEKNTSKENHERETTEERNTTSKDTVSGDKTSNKVIISSPAGASVYLDGEYVGIAPISFTKVTGSHIITLNQSGYLSKSYTEVFVDDGKDKTLVYNPLTAISSLIE